MRFSVLLLILSGLGCNNDKPSGTRSSSSPRSIERPMPADDEVRIPEGTFLMRRASFDVPASAFSPTATEREIAKSDAFAIDRNPATCADYEACEAFGGCPAYDRHHQECGLGAVLTTLEGARKYCAYRHRLLQTYAQWQRAVRGTDGRLFATGNSYDPEHACDERARPGFDYDCSKVAPTGVKYRLMNAFQGEWTRDIAPMKPYQVPVVVDEATQRLDQITTSIGVMMVRCVDEAPPTQPASGAVDTSTHAQ